MGSQVGSSRLRIFVSSKGIRQRSSFFSLEGSRIERKSVHEPMQTGLKAKEVSS